MKKWLNPVTAGMFTVFWMLGMAVCELTITFWHSQGLWGHDFVARCLPVNRLPVSYEDYDNVRSYLSVPFILAALFCLWGYQSLDIFRHRTGSALGSWSVAFMVFWTLFPPTWFFVEFHGITSGAISDPQSTSHVKEYADFASKIWAAFLVLYGFIVTHRIKQREEADKKKTVLPEDEV